MSSKVLPDQKQWLKRHERLSQSAVRGRYFPSVEDLKFGMPFFSDDMAFDAKTFAERLLLRLDRAHQDAADAKLVVALKCLTIDPGVEDYLFAASAFRNWTRGKSLSRALSEPEMRCIIYAAGEGDQESIIRVCGVIGRTLRHRNVNVAEMKAAIEMLLGVSLSLSEVGDWGNDAVKAMSFSRVRRLGNMCAERFLSFYQADDSTAAKLGGEKNADGPQKEETSEDNSTASGSSELSLLVFPKIGNTDHPDSEKVTKLFDAVVGKKLPLVRKPCLSLLRDTLNNEFPHAPLVIDTILRDMTQRDQVAFRPVILSGKPGCGKTRFASRLASLLGVPSEVYGCAGINDSAFGGTARRWSSTEAAMPVWLIANSGVANPMIILDEIEKASQNKHNGSLLDCLLPMFEASSAKNFFDVFIQSSVNISAVLWVGTSNDPSLLPKPLRDRCRIIPFPNPTAQHLPALVKAILCDIAIDNQMDPRWIGPLTGKEMEAVAEVWPGGSVRALRRYVEGVLTARDMATEAH
jgi:hypothetical protein